MFSMLLCFKNIISRYIDIFLSFIVILKILKKIIKKYYIKVEHWKHIWFTKRDCTVLCNTYVITLQKIYFYYLILIGISDINNFLKGYW